MNKPSESVRRHVFSTHCQRKRFSGRLLAAAGAASTVLLGGAEYAHAHSYTVYTSATSAMSLNANDGYCSLAEAVASANAGHSMYNCQDSDQGDSQWIMLTEAVNKPFSSYHYKITSLTLNAPGTWVTLTNVGSSRARIDSTGLSAFIIQSGSDLTFAGINLTYTGGTSGGRLVENYGTMYAYDGIFSNGNVTTHTTGRGGAIYNAGRIGDLGTDLQLLNNKAKRGGAIYNNNGAIDSLSATISGNSATMAGGGIYNLSTVADAGGHPTTKIFAYGATITSNTAKAGGGVFNRGETNMYYSSITLNTASGTGSGETCASATSAPCPNSTCSCDGAGGGVLSVPYTSSMIAGFNLTGSATLADNKASGLGGGVYSTGILNLDGITIARNLARNGGAIYQTVLGASAYCEVSAHEAWGNTWVLQNGTSPTGGYSIFALGPAAVAHGLTCNVGESPGFSVTGSGNAFPYCQPGSYNPVCPQH